MENTERIDKYGIIKYLFEGAGLAGFTFHANFQLRFCCSSKKSWDNKNCPSEIYLNIMSDWWFGHKDGWSNLVTELTRKFDFIEPEEPVLAFKLAALRWTEGSTISSIRLSDESLELQFECGEKIVILNRGDSGAAWEVFGNDLKTDWSVVCEDGKIYL